MDIRVRTVRGKGFSVTVPATATVGQLRAAVAGRSGREILHLIYLGRFLKGDDASLVTDCKFSPQEFIVVVYAAANTGASGAGPAAATAPADADVVLVSAPAPASAGGHASGGPAMATASPPARFAHDRDVVQLTAMGFSEDQVRRALEANLGMPGPAMEMLLSTIVGGGGLVMLV